jgi:hypothetical protein
VQLEIFRAEKFNVETAEVRDSDWLSRRRFLSARRSTPNRRAISVMENNLGADISLFPSAFCQP